MSRSIARFAVGILAGGLLLGAAGCSSAPKVHRPDATGPASQVVEFNYDGDALTPSPAYVDSGMVRILVHNRTDVAVTLEIETPDGDVERSLSANARGSLWVELTAGSYEVEVEPKGADDDDEDYGDDAEDDEMGEPRDHSAVLIVR